MKGFNDMNRTKWASKFEGRDGRTLWRSGRILGNEITIPEGRRPFPDEERVYQKVKEVKVGKRKRDADDAVFDAIEEEE